MKEFDEERLREEYTIRPKKTNLERAKKLDRECKLPPLILAYTLGIVGTLILGIGMCLALGTIGGGTPVALGFGIALGVIGIAAIAANYPLYAKLLQRRKEKYASVILVCLNSEEEK